MKIENISLHTYQILLKNKQKRYGVFICLRDVSGNSGWGEISPLPGWSKETLEDCIEEIKKNKNTILDIDWSAETCLDMIRNFKLLPAVSFGLESGLFPLLAPIENKTCSISALFMGTAQEVLEQAQLRFKEGYTSAKLKVSRFDFEEAAFVINQLKDRFRLRIDVNRAWKTEDSLRFFSQFSQDAFDYVEEPFQDPRDLHLFTHPLAVDESYPRDLTLKELEALPRLKAIIYKPTIQGGMTGCMALHSWTMARNISLVMSSSFESDLGLMHVAAMAYRLSLAAPVGIGTCHHLQEYVCSEATKFSSSNFYINTGLIPMYPGDCLNTDSR